MPVIATPAANPSLNQCGVESRPVGQLATVPCTGQNYIAAPISTINGRVLLTRTRAVRVTSLQDANIQWQMHDRDGLPIDLSPCIGSSSSSSSESSAGIPGFRIMFRMRDRLSMDCHYASFESEATIIDAATGLVLINVPPCNTRSPGIFFAQVAAIADDADGNPYVLFANTFYVAVERGLWGVSPRHGSNVGPPTFAEIRLHLRDSDAAESYLLDNIRFDDAEIAMAIERPIMEWNETPPPIGTFTTQSFPFRFHWLEAICGNLFLMVAEQFRANNLEYSAAGISVNDQNKEPNYERAAAARLKTWRDWMRAKKSEINLSMCWGGIGSDYQYASSPYYGPW